MSIRILFLTGLIGLPGVTSTAFAGPQTSADVSFRQVDWPDTPAGRWAKAYVDAYNTPGENALREFVTNHFSEAELRETPVNEIVAEYFQPRHMGLERLEVHSVRTDGDFVAAVVAPAKPYGWIEFRFELSPEPPYDITNLNIGPAPQPAGKISGAKDYIEWSDLRDLVEQVRRDAQAPAIAAAIVHSGRTVAKVVTGVRRIDRPDRAEIGDRFHLGSVAKSFTATMIGKLVEDGVLHWDTTVGAALPDISMRTEYRGVTLEQLLQHRGGVRALCSTGEFAEGLTGLARHSPAEARAALVRQILTEEPFKLGEYAYSNAGYVVAAYMAEHAAKRSWEDLMRSHVFQPLKLRSAGFGWPATENRSNQPLGHSGIPPDLSVQGIGDHTLGNDDHYGPAGNVHCSIEDLARFATSHLQGLHGRDGVLKAETVRRLHTPVKGGHYMGGWVIREAEGWHGHEGTAGTFFAEMTLYPDSNLAVVAVANCGPAVAPFFQKMKEAIVQRMIMENSTPRKKAEVNWPDTIAARRARAFVEAMNAGNEESLRRFVTENYSTESLADGSIDGKVATFQGIRASTGKFIVNSVQTDGELSAIVVVQCQPLGIWLELTITLKKEPPHYWGGVQALPTAPPQSTAP